MALLRTSTDHDAPPVSLDAARPTAALLAALRSGVTVAERREAALELVGTPEAAGDLATALCREAEASVREAIVTTLVLLASDEAAAGLAALLASEDVALRSLAIEGLREIGAVAQPHVERLLASEDPDIRIFALNTLDLRPYPQVQSLLYRVLEQDPEVNVGLAAVEVLSQIGGLEDLPVLRAFAARFACHPFAGFAVDLVCRRATPGGGP